MLLIKPIEDKKMQEAVCAACGAAFRPDCLAYFAAEGDDKTFEPTALLGVCQFSTAGYIADLKPAKNALDEEALQIMARTAMNFMYRCECKTAELLPGACSNDLADKLCFLPGKDGKRALDLALYYESPCHYKNAVQKAGETNA